MSKFPSCWVFLPREHTFAEEDQVALISGFTTYQEIINEGDWAKVVECRLQEGYDAPSGGEDEWKDVEDDLPF